LKARLGAENTESILDLQDVLVLEQLHLLGEKGELAHMLRVGIGKEEGVIRTLIRRAYARREEKPVRSGQVQTGEAHLTK